MSVRSYYRMGLLILIVSAAFGCGGSSSTKSTSGELGDGRIYLKNQTEFTLTASYLSEDQGILETVLKPGEKKDVSQAVLKGGTKVKVHVISDREPRGEPINPEVDIEVTVGGNIIILVTQVGLYGNPGAWQWQLVTE